MDAKGTDGANTPSRQHPGTISDRHMDDLGRRAERRSPEETAKWAATHEKAYRKRKDN
jgi:hypothetical protein